MPKKARANYFNFSGGLNTDASPLNRSPVTITLGDNCKINLDGSIESRRGMELISDTLDTGSSETVQYPYDVRELEFADPNDIASERFQAIIIGETLKLYDGDVTEMDGTPTSSISITIPKLDGTWLGYGEIPWDGKNIITGDFTTRPLPDLDWPSKIEYTTFGGSTWSKTAINAEFKKDITVSASEPSTLTYQAGAGIKTGVHPYQENQTVWSSGSYTNVPDYSFTQSYTSGDQVRVEKGVIKLAAAQVDLTADAGDVDLVGILEKGMPIKINKPSGAIYDTVNEVYLSGSDYYIILDNLSDTEGITGITVYETRKIVEHQPMVLKPAIGRLFMVTQFKPNRLYFSQVYTKDITNMAKFYTEANPVHPVDNAVVASDGGFIDINGLSNIRKIEEVNGSIVVFADNGVWECVGSDGLFRADDFVVRQISNKGIVGRYAATRMEDGIVYASKDGINYLAKDPQSGILMGINSLTDNKIQNYITDLPYNMKAAMKIKYNDIDKELYVLYNDIEPDYVAESIEEKASTLFRRILIFKLRLGAWYKYSLAVDTDFQSLSIQDIYTAKYDDSGTLLDVPIVVYAIQDGTSPFTQKAGYGRLYTTQEYDFSTSSTYAEYNTGNFSAAHQTYGDLMRGKINNYVKVLYEGIETSTDDDHGWSIPLGGCKLRAAIDFADDPVEVTDAFGQPFNSNVAYGKYYEIYPTETSGFSHHTYKHKLLGRGNVLQYDFKNYLKERWYVAAQNSTGESPISGGGNYWTETTEAAYVADGGGAEWAIGTSYTTGDYVKVTKITHFKIIGWSAEMIPTEGLTTK